MHPNIIKARNQYVVKGDEVYLTIIRRDGSEVVVVFDRDDLEAVKRQGSWHIGSWSVAGGERKEYCATSLPGQKLVTLHRFLLDTPKGTVCALEDGNPLNCRRSNLKLTDRPSLHARDKDGIRSGVRWISFCRRRDCWIVSTYDYAKKKVRNVTCRADLEEAKKIRAEYALIEAKQQVELKRAKEEKK